MPLSIGLGFARVEKSHAPIPGILQKPIRCSSDMNYRSSEISFKLDAVQHVALAVRMISTYDNESRGLVSYEVAGVARVGHLDAG